MSDRPHQSIAKVFMSGRSQAVRLPREFRFECSEVAIRRVGRHVILSPKYESWADYWANSTRPSDDFVDAVLNRGDDELALEERESLDP